MIDPCTLCAQLYPKRMLPLVRIASLLSVVGGLAGLTSVLSGCSPEAESSSPTPTPTSLSFNDEELKNYARVVLAIEPIRQSAYKEIQRTPNAGRATLVVCNQPNSLGSLSKDAQTIAQNYCSQAKKIGESNGLTMSQFNAITVNALSNPALQRRIQNEFVTMQR